MNSFRFKDYVFYGDTTVAKSAQLNTRYGTESLKGVLQDIHFLSLCDYLVCTFSSQVRRTNRSGSRLEEYMHEHFFLSFRFVVSPMK